MQGLYIVDADGHVRDNEDELKRYLEPQWARRIFLFPKDAHDRDLGGVLGKRNVNAKVQLEDMDLEGIDMAILYPTNGLFIGEIRDRDFAIAVSRAYNNWLHDYCQTDPQRLKGIALVPLQDVQAACEEAERAVKDLGFCGVMFPTYFRYATRSCGDPYFDPFYATCERLGVPVAFHATGGERGECRFDTFLGLHLFSHVPEQMISLTNFILGGVLEKFPRLTAGFMEAGCGWLPFWMEHMDEEYEKRKHEAPLLTKEPSEYVRSGRIYIGCEPEEKLLPIVAQMVRDDILLYASDYPHWDSDWPHTVKTVRERTDLSDELKRKVLSENALRFYGLQAPVTTS
ncbi:MAG TPA: amidohydrolase family protein [Chloroflexota bacterium]|jgi:predicted TIM-barrel fold metal-dependent hydrolase|nr:amidohydrolase family protein [Chloroflexota bacterium]